jgi:hypothetical protein
MYLMCYCILIYLLMKSPFRRDYFNEGPYVLPGKIFLDTLASITAAEDYDDENSTHPNIKKRKTAITTWYR